ncbi:DUF262 domain-containing protein [Pigmentibacter sp. JX0631]|uniref:HNH endonuclease family protein n=1 Tax=Pigmentibacter sp. JX0631 TaxID=2976982 RepID=UPI002469A07A|nr:DUF262 domain-containing protein [Pigmentibacter sp. JX0631]WGL61262.1 DUF262 domain-containing protein [Pigmentibacter sp. JX0631]
MSKVNLDALIPREDFKNDNSYDEISFKKNDFSISDLESYTALYLRKPDFQRETNEWDKEKIADFIESFLNGDLIPAIILWKAKNGLLFVIDGSHRLSALLGWVRNDYGDGEISKKFYNQIPEEQISIAEDTKKHIRKKIGLYSDYKLALTNPDKVDEKIRQKHRNLASIGLQLQWVSGDHQKAEHSFININQKGSPIDATELRLIKGRYLANCITSRAIIKSGEGHKYWSNFDKKNQDKIQDTAKEIHDILFLPKLETPIKTLDIPIGGQTFKSQTLPLVFDCVNIINDTSSKDILKNNKDDGKNDKDGTETIKFLEKTLKIMRRINSDHASSLGLHPAVYFYSQHGRHKPVSLYAIIALIKEFEADPKKYHQFTKIRDKFEDFIIKNDDLISQITRKKRGGREAYNDIKDLFLEIIKLTEVNSENIFNDIIKIKKFNYLKSDNQQSTLLTSSETKSNVFLSRALDGCIKCSICNGYLHKNSITMDHILRKREGGSNNVKNLQPAHPYCNTTFKQ